VPSIISLNPNSNPSCEESEELDGAVILTTRTRGEEARGYEGYDASSYGGNPAGFDEGYMADDVILERPKTSRKVPFPSPEVFSDYMPRTYTGDEVHTMGYTPPLESGMGPNINPNPNPN